MSIPVHPAAFRLPDFRNQGVWLRLLLLANLLMICVAIVGNRVFDQLPREIAELAALTEPALLLLLALLYAAAPLLQHLPGRLGMLVVVVFSVAIMAAVDVLLAQRLAGGGSGWRAPLGAGLGAFVCLAWFDLAARARTPALAEARLAALTARIRPHFLFNSLNAVLGLIRADPRRAETALEELAELFRALMRDSAVLTTLAEEIALARKYIELERLRLGERLQVCWNVQDCPDTRVPSLLLQPLLENAVYHGVEPGAGTGEITVRIAATREGVRIEIDNPWLGEESDRHGNHMALENLRERLLLFYDLEARLENGVSGDRYRVRIDLPARPHD